MNQKPVILIVSDRSDYFSFLGTHLEEDYAVLYLAVTPKDSELLQKAGKKPRTIESLIEGANKQEQGFPLTTEEVCSALRHDMTYDRLYNQSRRQEELIHRGIKYAIGVQQLLDEYQVNLVIVQNDLVGSSAIVLSVARKKNIKTLIFEDGFFRPNTVVLDDKGVNYNNSCPRDPAFYERWEQDETRLSAFIEAETKEREVPSPGWPFRLSQLVTLIEQPSKIVHFLPKLSIYHDEQKYKKQEINNYVLLPLQVRDDTQIMCHSSLTDMCELVRICIAALKRYNKTAAVPLALIVKEHPLDQYLADIQCAIKRTGVPVYYISRIDIRTLIRTARLVITVNSTAGIESLLYEKPVITLGNAFYNIEGIVHHCGDYHTLDKCIDRVLKEPVNYHLRRKFLDYLRFCYQREGNLDHPTKENIQPVLQRIKQVMKTSI